MKTYLCLECLAQSGDREGSMWYGFTRLQRHLDAAHWHLRRVRGSLYREVVPEEYL